MPADYATLAPLYDQLKMAQFAEVYTPKLINYAHQNEWLGRQLIDIGCGTGASVRWLGTHSYNITGVDASADMLNIARRSIDAAGLSIQWVQNDMRTLEAQKLGSGFHMALALDVLNEVNTLRDLEITFTKVHALLETDKLFVFDLHTTQGLSDWAAKEAQVIANDADTFITVENQFDYERQNLTNAYHIFTQQTGGWSRNSAQRTLRAFPVQAVVALLGRVNFGIMALLNLRLQPIELNTIREPRVIIMARKLGT